MEKSLTVVAGWILEFPPDLRKLAFIMPPPFEEWWRGIIYEGKTGVILHNG